MATPQIHTRPLTGWHMAAMFGAFFGVVIAVNLTMATLAHKSWTGLIVANSYVASQTFNDDTARREAVLARGDKFELRYADGSITLSMKDRMGLPLSANVVELKLFHTVAAQTDTRVKLDCHEGLCTSALSLAPGFWRGDLLINLPGQGEIQQAVEIIVKAD